MLHSFRESIQGNITERYDIPKSNECGAVTAFLAYSTKVQPGKKVLTQEAKDRCKSYSGSLSQDISNPNTFEDFTLL